MEKDLKRQIYKRHMEEQENDKNKDNIFKKAIEKKDKHIVESFDSDDHFVYLYKKTERLIMATYMVTDVMSDSEPIKSQIRKISIGLLSALFLLKDETSLDKAVMNVQEVVLKVVSLLDVAYVTGRITEMNASVLKREFKNLLEYIRLSVEKKKSSGGTVSLSSSFFDIDTKEDGTIFTGSTQKDDPSSTSYGYDVSDSNNRFDNLKDKDTTKEQSKQFSSGFKSKKSHSRPSGYIGNVAKNERRAAIFNLLREKKEITVRDLASVVTDCSEKTLQRELLQLVEEGILRKEGERRWSRYSLVV